MAHSMDFFVSPPGNFFPVDPVQDMLCKFLATAVA